MEGELIVTLEWAKGLKNCDVFKNQDPYVELTVGQVTAKSRTHARGGSQPTWNENFRFTLHKEVEMVAKIMDRDRLFAKLRGGDDLVGTAKVNLVEARGLRQQHMKVPVMRNGAVYGELSFLFNFLPRNRTSLQPAPTSHSSSQSFSHSDSGWLGTPPGSSYSQSPSFASTATSAATSQGFDNYRPYTPPQQAATPPAAAPAAAGFSSARPPAFAVGQQQQQQQHMSGQTIPIASNPNYYSSSSSSLSNATAVELRKQQGYHRHPSKAYSDISTGPFGTAAAAAPVGVPSASSSFAYPASYSPPQHHQHQQQQQQQQAYKSSSIPASAALPADAGWGGTAAMSTSPAAAAAGWGDMSSTSSPPAAAAAAADSVAAAAAAIAAVAAGWSDTAAVSSHGGSTSFSNPAAAAGGAPRSSLGWDHGSVNGGTAAGSSSISSSMSSRFDSAPPNAGFASGWDVVGVSLQQQIQDPQQQQQQQRQQSAGRMDSRSYSSSSSFYVNQQQQQRPYGRSSSHAGSYISNSSSSSMRPHQQQQHSPWSNGSCVSYADLGGTSSDTTGWGLPEGAFVMAGTSGYPRTGSSHSDIELSNSISRKSSRSNSMDGLPGDKAGPAVTSVAEFREYLHRKLDYMSKSMDKVYEQVEDNNVRIEVAAKSDAPTAGAVITELGLANSKLQSKLALKAKLKELLVFCLSEADKLDRLSISGPVLSGATPQELKTAVITRLMDTIQQLRQAQNTGAGVIFMPVSVVDKLQSAASQAAAEGHTLSPADWENLLAAHSPLLPLNTLHTAAGSSSSSGRAGSSSSGRVGSSDGSSSGAVGVGRASDTIESFGAGPISHIERQMGGKRDKQQQQQQYELADEGFSEAYGRTGYPYSSGRKSSSSGGQAHMAPAPSAGWGDLPSFDQMMEQLITAQDVMGAADLSMIGSSKRSVCGW